MPNERFRAVAIALSPWLNDTYALISAADAVVALDVDQPTNLPVVKSPDGLATYDFYFQRWVFPYSELVDMVIGNDVVMGFMYDNRKIMAIKELRSISNCGLKQAKNAVEDERVSMLIASYHDFPPGY